MIAAMLLAEHLDERAAQQRSARSLSRLGDSRSVSCWRTSNMLGSRRRSRARRVCGSERVAMKESW
jgi:hypothetical protein